MVDLTPSTAVRLTERRQALFRAVCERLATRVQPQHPALVAALAVRESPSEVNHSAFLEAVAKLRGRERDKITNIVTEAADLVAREAASGND